MLVIHNILRRKENGRHFADDNSIFFNENICIFTQIHCNLFTSKPINQYYFTKRQATSQYLKQRWSGLLMHKFVTRPGRVKIMMTSSNGNIFRVTGPLCGEFTGPGEFPTQRPVTRSFDVFFGVRLIKRLSKHSRGWWFETLSHPLWRHRNVRLKCSHDKNI